MPPRQDIAENELTRTALAEQFTALGVRPGAVLLVQASLRRLGPVEGGGTTVVEALLDALGGPGRGTLVAYTATPENSDTSRLVREMTKGWSPEEVEAWRAHLPAFDPYTTPSSPTMGRLSELVRTHPGAVRSDHPQSSFAAVGARAKDVTELHELTCHLGTASPLGRMYELGADVLGIGVGMARFTPFHLADLQMPDIPVRHYGCVVREGGGRRWVHFDGPLLDDLHFAELGEEVLREAAGVRRGRVGGADCRLVPMREAVDLAVGILRRRRWLRPDLATA
ncbi:aminoglycoside N(3)-acetyltransferase [Kitasatospora sp. A2-31]|uniref:aminoglycoside N(3)-acetyltransferase n=1 Tax=Kitasatospora sp. A2-31 TaxID=2916414 RepID=UPI001EEC8AA8|nr:AAC(3) family N-acetyltransferase [Kitasatospora sp. A2-31]MCG6495102.1 AAC(3) family N-acetyltransferase [Kitasatospora sp. A2-31]MCG6500016.1 AAC(3) family N-acetyltransferase [Kitasatospora sp. A2-31]